MIGILILVGIIYIAIHRKRARQKLIARVTELESKIKYS